MKPNLFSIPLMTDLDELGRREIEFYSTRLNSSVILIHYPTPIYLPSKEKNILYFNYSVAVVKYSLVAITQLYYVMTYVHS